MNVTERRRGEDYYDRAPAPHAYSSGLGSYDFIGGDSGAGSGSGSATSPGPVHYSCSDSDCDLMGRLVGRSTLLDRVGAALSEFGGR
ncbi:hypothetical protein FCM35_KLT09337 [Carex littledalei]|uniref:Uncharacterized protein n=1 Tax=Carex littledalei TaxID=544730 RepID=A0A833RTH2_9POAL|nr:hypothetical protein FCM35_KLT09337 [Carex littledalei]